MTPLRNLPVKQNLTTAPIAQIFRSRLIYYKFISSFYTRKDNKFDVFMIVS